MSNTQATRETTQASGTAATTVATAATNTAAPQKKLSLEEDDDEFEDFPVDDWDAKSTVGASQGAAQGQGTALWEENWDDVEVDDEFTQTLRSELQA
ncbi:proteasome regulatory particle lid subunit SEM1 KNAG_0C04970 [Huiozyma naganishii CBS 8797]|uniref:26S proteasome complex subunit SEM1 n=1 Tax=Huiozyma naganishii (strain ATCC MYA-139 / BCRC 22969 / CBS 8797 / KCTC 17520 / NBRC 10181 / NCYC 3082 / Yp74L-3) TaxID=1071383 RepID=J7RJA0_HUIN7|nr:hypothetical protein KNAG_0C04970 [Kazachstania naganishii CBS 8797]CCK69598.1 hypothetical protein KNAG_0C04970 [Kazachstania naganishii CBS 8797]